MKTIYLLLLIIALVASSCTASKFETGIGNKGLGGTRNMRCAALK